MIEKLLLTPFLFIDSLEVGFNSIDLLFEGSLSVCYVLSANVQGCRFVKLKNTELKLLPINV